MNALVKRLKDTVWKYLNQIEAADEKAVDFQLTATRRNNESI